MLFFYVLIYGTNWDMASKFISNSYRYRSTLNRFFNYWIKVGIISNSYEKLLNKYISSNDISELVIDSTDIMNGNCSKKETHKSIKLSKQAIRLTVLADKNKIPINYRIDSAKSNDSKLGCKLILESTFKTNNILIAGDKGYIINNDNKKLLKRKNINLITPKKKYKKKIYKTKGYKSKIKRIRHTNKMKGLLGKRICAPL